MILANVIPSQPSRARKAPSMGRAKGHSPAYTLLEMLVVLGIVGLLLAIATPNIASFISGYRLRGAAREVGTDLQFARMLAVKENRDIIVDVHTNSYQVKRSDNTVAKSRDLNQDYTGVSLTSGMLVFDSRGSFDPTKNAGANSATITVSNPHGTVAVTVSRTGKVKVG